VGGVDPAVAHGDVGIREVESYMTTKSWESLYGYKDLPREVVLGRLAYFVKRQIFRLSMPRRRLFSPLTTTLKVTPPDPWPGNAERGAEITQRIFDFADRRIEDPDPLWFPRGASAAWLTQLHDFSWLRDLRALGGDQARRKARDLTQSWIENHRSWTAHAWSPAIVGRRLANWLGQYDFFVASADLEFRQAFIDSAERQAQHLSRILPAGLTGATLIGAVKGLTLAGAAIPEGAVWCDKGLELLERELKRQILPDGGHIERSPAALMSVLRDLIDIRAALCAAEIETPPDIETAIANLAPLLRLFQHGDGKLALFNGTNEGDSLHIDLVLQRCPGPKRPLMTAPESGFHRLQASRAVVIVDAGAPPPRGYDTEAHAGTLSFEFSIGRERVIVNCGAQIGPPDWRQAQRSTAAHSTLSLDDRNSSQVVPGNGLGTRPTSVTSRRTDEEGALLLETCHDGYRDRMGYLHHRSFYLSGAGDDLRGEDRLEATSESNAAVALPFAVRFHLHPEIKTVISQSGNAVLLGTRNSGGWRMLSSGATVSLEPSVYLGDPEKPRRSQQIVLSGTTKGRDTVIKWAFRKEG